MADPADIAHLLRRTEFVARPGRVAALSAGTIAQAVDDIMDIGRNGVTTIPSSLTFDDPGRGWEQYTEATNWWLGEMLNKQRPIQEKLTLFWHGHFTSSWWDGIGRADHMMHQNQLYRELAMGNFRTLTQRMALEPAMLVYLNNAENVAAAPNQNFARELLELFTLGVGNYTEDDVVAAARAWTGHNALWPAYAYTFRSNKHDNGNKTFFGTTKNWDGPDIINEVLRDNAGKKLIAARYITKKLWDFFAHPGGSSTVINELADVFLANDLELAPLLRALFNRPEFYSVSAKQGLVRTPIDAMVALSFHSGITFGTLGAAWMGERMGQSVYNPPNVAGWKANAAWLNTSALSARAQMVRGITWRLRLNGGFDYLHDLSVEAAVDSVATFFALSLSTTSRNALIASHRAERSVQTWKSYWSPTNLLTMAMLTPEFHMA
ncbi:MAG: DUF1800 domain-containing protein [Ilumatobacteraceae bacterium]